MTISYDARDLAGEGEAAFPLVFRLFGVRIFLSMRRSDRVACGGEARFALLLLRATVP